MSTLAGIGEMGHPDGERVASAQFNDPAGVAVDENGHIILADRMNHCIRRVTFDGAVNPPLFSLPPLLLSSLVSDIQRHLYEASFFHDVCFVVEQERVLAHRAHLSARCEYFRSMFSAGFREGDGGEIHIKCTSIAAFKAILKYLYLDSLEVDDDDAVLFELAKLSDQYQVERLHNHCLHKLFKGITIQNAVMRLIKYPLPSLSSPYWLSVSIFLGCLFVGQPIVGVGM
jgi:hypothetical protein